MTAHSSVKLADPTQSSVSFTPERARATRMSKKWEQHARAMTQRWDKRATRSKENICGCSFLNGGGIASTRQASGKKKSRGCWDPMPTQAPSGPAFICKKEVAARSIPSASVTAWRKPGEVVRHCRESSAKSKGDFTERSTDSAALAHAKSSRLLLQKGQHAST